MSHIAAIDLDDSNLAPPTPEIEQERKVAMFDLLEDNSFALPVRDDRDVCYSHTTILLYYPTLKPNPERPDQIKKFVISARPIRDRWSITVLT